jgi:hypothetical protein
MQRIIDAGDNHEDEDAEEGLSSIEEILGSRTQKKPQSIPLIREMDKMLGLVKDENNEIPLGIQSELENKRGDEIPPPIDEISISGFETDGRKNRTRRTNTPNTNPTNTG